MDQIKRQVRRAHQLLVLQQFLAIGAWSLFAALLVTAIGLTIPKFWVLNIDWVVWQWAWIGGGVGTGLLVAAIITWIVRRRALDAALEIDRRFQLRERVSSSLSLTPTELETEAGQALLRDATSRVEDLDIGEQFRVQAPWTVGLPVIPALIVFLLATIIPNAVREDVAQAKSKPAATMIKEKTDSLQKELQKKREQLQQEGLKDLEELLTQLQAAVDDLQAKDKVDRRQVMIKMNDIAKMIEEKRQQLAGSDEIRKQLDSLKDLQQGPADKMAEAMRQGDFKSAAEELEKLKDKLTNGSLSEAEQKQLAEQLEQLQKKLDEMRQAYDEMKRDLEEQIRQKQQMGDNQAVNELQKQLDQLNRMAPQMDRLDSMSESLGQCAQSMKNGDAAQAASELGKLMESMQQMQSEMSDLQTLNEMLDDIAMVKDGLSDEPSDGMPSEGMPGMQGMSLAGQPGYGMNQGQGRGDRPEEANDTGTYNSRVQGDVRKGQAILAGTADGPNIAGMSREQAREAIMQSMREQSAPIADDQLPRDQREHTRQYFKRYQPSFDAP